MSLFDKRSAFHPDWIRGLHESDTEYYSRLERERRGSEDNPGSLQRTAQVKRGVVEIPKRELEEIIEELNYLGARLDENGAGPDHNDTDDIVGRLASYFSG